MHTDSNLFACERFVAEEFLFNLAKDRHILIGPIDLLLAAFGQGQVSYRVMVHFPLADVMILTIRSFMLVAAIFPTSMTSLWESG